MVRASIITLGCKINQCESDSVAYLLESRGYTVSEREEAAELFVVNTCAVTGEAERKCRQTVRRLAKRYPASRIIVVGCSAQRDSEAYAEFPNVAAVGGTYDKCGLLEHFLDNMYTVPETAQCRDYLEYPPKARFRTREVIKVQDGCDHFCSYCIVPYLRGRSRSRTLERVIAEAETVRAKEIVISGIDLSSYRDGGRNLAELLASIAHPRIRLGSLEPNVVTERLLEIMRPDRYCKHFHLSMQSGSDRVLKAMNRRYTSADYLKKIELIRQYYPMANITTDCIAGFPTETEAEHRETLAFVEKVGFGDMHVFPYSERKGTRAAEFEQVAKETRSRRAGEIAAVAAESRQRYLNAWVGQTATVLTEQTEDGCVTGYTPEYVKVKLPAGTPLDALIESKITGSDKECVRGSED